MTRALALAWVLFVAPAWAQASDPDPFWGPDKALHFGISAALAGAGYGVTSAFTESRPARLAVGASVALAAGVGKELLDLAGLGHPSWKDFAWDVIGAATGLLVAFVIDWFIVRPLSTAPPRPVASVW